MSIFNFQSSPVESHVPPVALLSRVLRGHLLHRYRGALPTPELHRVFEEAERLAEESGFPHLVLPVLAEERLRLAAEDVMSVEGVLNAA